MSLPFDHADFRRVAPSLSLVAILLGVYAYFLHVEWMANEQYSHGSLIPFLFLYLLVQRLPSAPLPRALSLAHKKLLDLTLFFTLLLFGPLLLLFKANPDWRLIFWVVALLIFLSICLLAIRTGGRPWGTHFVGSAFIFFTAVPWPTRIEGPILDGLISAVTTVVVWILPLLGIYAEEQGNLILLTNGPVGVEEACSGIRSFQLGLLVAWFFGDLHRCRPAVRISLLFAALIVAFASNLFRTLALTLLFHRGGDSLMQEWHDFVGFLTMFGSVCLIFGISFLVRRRTLSKPRHDPVTNLPAWPSWTVTLVAVLTLVFGFAWVTVHYQLRGSTPSGHRLFEISDFNLPSDWTSRPIPHRSRAILRYSEGYSGEGYTNEGDPIKIFLLSWDRNRVSSFVGVHRPEICLPSVGWTLMNHGKTFSVVAQGGPIDFEVIQFTHHTGHRMVVYFSVVDLSSGRELISPATTARQRVQSAINGLRIIGRQSIGIYFIDPPSLIETQREVARLVGSSPES